MSNLYSYYYESKRLVEGTWLVDPHMETWTTGPFPSPQTAWFEAVKDRRARRKACLEQDGVKCFILQYDGRVYKPFRSEGWYRPPIPF